MPPGDIELRGGPTGFTNQGQVDWVAFGNTIFSASLRVMQRLAAANIQPITHSGGLLIGSQFRLGDLGTRRFEEALANLPCSPMFDKVIYIGFGLQSYVKTLAETQSGANLAALCGCLTAVHTEWLSSQILAALWDQLDFPFEYKPSNSQFKELVQSCSGVCHATTFNSTMDVMLGGRGSTRRRMSPREDSTRPFEASSAKDIAASIKGLFDLSSGKMERICVTGGASVAYIAALAYWLFNFRVQVFENDGNIIFTSCGDSESVQVHVQYVGTSGTETLQVAAKSYILRPPARENLITMDVEEYTMMHMIVRTPWKGCLERGFGSLVTECIRRPRQLGVFLGGVARIYTALAMSEPDTAFFSRDAFNLYTPRSYGLGFIEIVMSLLRSLNGHGLVEEIMVSSLKASMEEAIHAVEESAFELKRVCQCSRCRGCKGQGRLEFDCLPAMAMTIRRLAHITSTCTNTHGIEPTVLGLETVYWESNGTWDRAIDLFEKDCKEGMISAILGLTVTKDRPFLSLFDLCDGVEVFLGTSVRYRVGNHSDPIAFSISGLCVYSQALVDITCQPEAMRQVCILPGHISYRDKRYNRIREGVAGGYPVLEPISYVRTKSVLAELSPSKHHAEPVQMQAVVTETVEGDNLRFVYRATGPSGSFPILPMDFVVRVFSAVGARSCDSYQCSLRHSDRVCHNLDFECAIVKSGGSRTREILEALPYHSDVAYCIWNPVNNEPARCVRLYYVTMDYIGHHLNITERTVLRHHACITCSIQSAFDYAKKMIGKLKEKNPEAKLVLYIV